MALLAFVLFGLILLISGKDPISSYRDILVSTLGSTYGLSEVVVTMTPLLLTALAVALPSRVGLINVGGEGQLYMGAGLATWGALTFAELPPGCCCRSWPCWACSAGPRGPGSPASCGRAASSTRPSRPCS